MFHVFTGMKEVIKGLLVNHTAASAPCEHIANQVMLDGRWSDLDCPSKSQVKNFVQSHFSQKKKAAEHALSRQGKRSYNNLSLEWLKASRSFTSWDGSRSVQICWMYSNVGTT